MNFFSLDLMCADIWFDSYIYGIHAYNCFYFDCKILSIPKNIFLSKINF